MQNYFFTLDHYDFIRISGADSVSFLQGQLSCNTELLSAEHSLTGALCNLKGRVIADFRLLQLGEDIVLQSAAGMAGKILETLNKYAVFSKVELQQLTAESPSTPRTLGFIGTSVDAALSNLQLELPLAAHEVSHGADCSVVRLPGASKRIEIWFYSDAATTAFLHSSDIQASDMPGLWSRAEIEAGIVHITPELSEEYTPQLLNYDVSGLIDFKKGCYTGQEIVARMYYRGTAKKRLFLITSSQDVSESSEVVRVKSGDATSDGSKILAFENCHSPTLLLAILASEATEAGHEYRLSDQPESELLVKSLHYDQQLTG